MLRPDPDVEVFKERLMELRKRVKRDIYAWTKSFVNEFQRQPNKTERKEVAGHMFRAYSGVSLLFAFCFLLFAFCFLLFAFCFLLFWSDDESHLLRSDQCVRS